MMQRGLAQELKNALDPSAAGQDGQGDGFSVGQRTRRCGPNAEGGENSAAWLITFADMVTLLLTFLVLIVSVTTLDPRDEMLLPPGDSEQRWAEHSILGDSTLMYSPGLLAPVMDIIDQLPNLPPDLMFDPVEIKAAIFQLDPAKADDYQRLAQSLAEGVEIYHDQRGLVIQWDRALIFPEASGVILEENIALIKRLAAFLVSVSLPVSLESHTNPLSELEGGRGPAGYELSLMRAKTLMKYLVSLGLEEQRFRLGAWGGSRPRSLDPELGWENSRLEIVIYRPNEARAFGS